MKPFQLHQLITGQFPESCPNFIEGSLHSVYRVMQAFADFTKSAMYMHNEPLAKRCFGLAGVFYRNGDGELKQAIENVFMFSIVKVIDTVPERNLLLSDLPEVLCPIKERMIRSSSL